MERKAIKLGEETYHKKPYLEQGWGARDELAHGKRWRAPKPGEGPKLKACLWCIKGDLVYDTAVYEWYCVQCGWREYERSRREYEETRVQASARKVAGCLPTFGVDDVGGRLDVSHVKM